MAILKKLYLLLLLPVILTGCYEDFTPDVDTRPVLCINSLITAGEPVSVSVTRTWLFTDEADHTVSDATVSVYVNGLLQPPGYIAREGDRIHILVDSPTYGRAEAEVTVPFAVPIQSVDWEALSVDVWRDDVPGWPMLADLSFNLNARLTLADAPDVDNYYMFSYLTYGPATGSDDSYINSPDCYFYPGTFKYESEPIFSEHIGTFEYVSGADSEGFRFFTDRQFPGRTYTLNLRFDNMQYYVRSTTFDERLLDCGLSLTLSTVSQSYYEWANYCWQTGDGIIGDLGDVGLGDPVPAYSNVSTGAGVVAACTQSTCTVSLRDFLSHHVTTPR